MGLPGPDMMALPLTLHNNNAEKVVRDFRMLWHLSYCYPDTAIPADFNPQALFALHSLSHFFQVSLPRD